MFKRAILINDLHHPSLGMNGSRMRCQARRGVQAQPYAWLAGWGRGKVSKQQPAEANAMRILHASHIYPVFLLTTIPQCRGGLSSSPPNPCSYPSPTALLLLDIATI